MGIAAVRLRAKQVTAGGGFSTITDAFNRADSATTLGNTDTGQTWSYLAGTWGISSNKAYKVSPSSSQTYAVVDAAVADCTISITVSGTTNAGGGITFRATDVNNLWFVDVDVTGASLYKVVAGSFTNVHGSLANFVAGDILSVVLSGTSVIVKKNGGTIHTSSETFNQTATKHGLRDYTGSVRLDDFSITVP